MTRYNGPARFRLSSPAARRYTNAGRKLAGEAAARGTGVLALRQELDDGAVVTAEQVGGQLTIGLVEPPVSGNKPTHVNEDVLWAYISSPGGLRLFDLGAKKLVKTITGLQAYGVDAVSKDGKVVLMGAHGGGSIARVDLKAFTAFAVGYAVSTPVSGSPTETAVEPGVASGFDGVLSPDGKRFLVHFEGSGVLSGGTLSLREGVGGYILADAATLQKVRAPIRMSFEPFPAAWRPDSERFYLATSSNTDNGDIDNPVADLKPLTESVTDYISVFDGDGVLLGSKAVATFDSFTPDAGFQRKVQALAVSGDGAWLAAVLLSAGGLARSLHLYDATDDALPEIGMLDLAGLSALPSSLAFAPSNRRLSLVVPAVGVADVELDAEGAMTFLQQTNELLLHGYGPYRDWAPDRIINTPKGQTQLPPPDLQFFYNSGADASKRLVGYRGGFNHKPFYEYDLKGLPLNNKYRIAAVSVRPAKRTTQ